MNRGVSINMLLNRPIIKHSAHEAARKAVVDVKIFGSSMRKPSRISASRNIGELVNNLT